MKEIISLFAAFFRIGLFTFGGGYAMLPLIDREATEKHGWTTKEEILDIFSMSQCTPGVIAVNAATYVGNKVHGFFGALAATLGVITPSIIIITLIAAVFGNYAHLPAVVHAFAGVRAAVSALIFATCIKMFRSAIKSRLQLGVCIVSFIAVAVFGASPLIIVIASGIFGLFFVDISKINNEKEKNKGEAKNRGEAKDV